MQTAWNSKIIYLAHLVFEFENPGILDFIPDIPSLLHVPVKKDIVSLMLV